MNRTLFALIAGVAAGATATYLGLGRGLVDFETPGASIERDIDDVAAMSRAEAAKHRASQYENLHSIEQTLAFHGDFARTEALYVLAGRSDSGAVQNLIFDANRIANNDDREGALAILFLRLTELDPPSALALARSPAFSGDKAIESAVWRTWGKYDLDGALEAAASQASSGQRNRAAQALFTAYGYLGNETTDRIEDELGIRPDMTARGRYLYELADRSPYEAVEHVSNLKSGREQHQSAQWLANHLSRTDPDRAASYAVGFEDQQLAETYRNVVASRLAAADPKAVLDRMLANPGARMERAEVYGAMRELAANDIETAMQYLGQIKSTEARQTLGYLIAEELARQDPQRALQWARNNDRGESSQLLEAVLQQIALNDPQLALDEANAIRHAGRRDEAVANVVRAIARNDPVLAAKYVAEMKPGHQRQFVAANVFSKWVQTDPDAAIEWLSAEDSVDAESAMQRTAVRLMMTDMDTAIRILPKLDEKTAASWRLQIAQHLASESSAADAQKFIRQYEGTEEYDRLLASVVTGVAQNDVLKAKQLADQLAAGPSKDRAYEELVNQHAQNDAAAAATWLSQISGERRRGSATQSVMRAWYTQDPSSAQRWADNLPRGAQRDDAIVGLAFMWEEMTPSRNLLMDSIGNSDKKVQAQVARIQATARTDLQKAEIMLANSDLSGSERDRVQRTLDYYREGRP